MNTLTTPTRLIGAIVAAFCCGVMAAAADELPLDGWEGFRGPVKGLAGKHLAAVGYPAKQACALAFKGAKPAAPGAYRLRVKVASSHVCDEAAWGGSFEIVDSGAAASAGGGRGRTLATFPAIHFARAHQPEWRSVEWVHSGNRPLNLSIVAHMNEEAFAAYGRENIIQQGGPTADELDEPDAGDDLGDVLPELEVTLRPAAAFYCILADAELQQLSASGVIDGVAVDRVLYAPGETLTAAIAAHSMAGQAAGKLQLLLEWAFDSQELIQEKPVTLGPEEQTFTVKIPLHKDELGHALVARFVSADGKDVHERRECFSVAQNFQRVAIPGGFGGLNFTMMDDARLRAGIEESSRNYANYWEWFAWAEEDMVELTPDTEFWFSGQTCYHNSRAGAKRAVEIAHERGVKVVTYGKFIMSGYLGWKFAYDNPHDCKAQFFFPVGFWEGVNVPALDSFQFKEFVPYTTPWFHPSFASGSTFGSPFFQAFMPINPDPTPRMVKVAADEMARAIEMFGFDGVRWDGHPRTGPSMESTQYNFRAQRATALLVRYFKDLVAAKHSAFRHGYNCLPLTDDYGWAVENYELDELCRGGGLLMNEAQGNSTEGKTYEFRLKVLQTDGDLCRERGGYLLGTLGTNSQKAARDSLCEAVIKTAAGCRGVSPAAGINRFLTRYSALVYDENLRRLAQPENVIRPLEKTGLQWNLFVYETPRIAGREQLVVHLLNLPLDAKWSGEQDKHIVNAMNDGTAPVDFQLTPPEGCTPRGAWLIDPCTLEKEPLRLQEGKLAVPSISDWKLLVLDFAVDAASPPMHAKWGVPPTAGRTREDVKDERAPLAPLDVAADPAGNAAAIAAVLQAPPSPFDERPGLRNLAWDDRNAELLKIRALPANQPDAFIAGWWKGGTLPADLKLKDAPPKFGSLAPRRDGVLDVFYARGALDGRLRFYEAIARFDRFRIREATLAGGRTSYGLNGSLAPDELPAMDLLVYVDVPHSAIGVENSYALVDYVKAGGAVLFTGGEYAFGKGGWAWTVLDRDLLPVQCIETVDTRYSPEPIAIEPGPDWQMLNAPASFDAKPAMWCWNQVALRPGADVKIFLRAGNRPALVGWQLGKGRVACILAAHKGASDPAKNVTAFFDWAGWPAVMTGVLRWLAPEAGKADAQPPALSADEIAAISAELEAGELEDLGGLRPTPGARDDAGDDIFSVDDDADAPPGIKARILPEPALKERCALLRKLAESPSKQAAALAARQLAGVANIPQALRFDLLDLLRRHPPTGLAKIAMGCLNDPDPAVRGSACQMLGMAGHASFGPMLSAEPPALEQDPVNRARSLACGVAMYPRDDRRSKGSLAAEAASRIAALNQAEQKNTQAYTRGAGFSLAAPEQPMLNSEDIFARLAWLCYLSGIQPESHAPQFVREWLMEAQYEYYCDVRIGNIWEDKRLTNEQKARMASKVAEFRMLLRWMGRIAADRVHALMKDHPQAVAEGMRRAHFHREARRAIAFLGGFAPDEARTCLDAIAKDGGTVHPLLQAFCTARIGKQ